jgi:hypothetical protein
MDIYQGRDINGYLIHKEMLNLSGIKEMQVKATLRFHLTSVRMAIIKNTNNNNSKYRHKCGGEKNPYSLLHMYEN